MRKVDDSPSIYMYIERMDGERKRERERSQ